MLESLIMQVTGQQVVESGWNLIDSIMTFFMIVSGISITVALRLRKGLANSTNENAQKIVKVIDDYIIPVFSKGQEVVTTTRNQELKLKEYGEILYSFMGPKADEISGKLLVKMDNLNNDVNNANKMATEYQEKINRLIELSNQLRSESKSPA